MKGLALANSQIVPIQRLDCLIALPEMYSQYVQSRAFFTVSNCVMLKKSADVLISTLSGMETPGPRVLAINTGSRAILLGRIPVGKYPWEIILPIMINFVKSTFGMYHWHQR